MINKNPEVLITLEEIDGVYDVFFYYPESFVNLPCISFYEISNSPYTNADDDEYMSEINVMVDIWANTSDETSRIINDVNIKMKQIGFVREFSHDLYEPDRQHKTSRYRFIGGI